MLEIAWKSLRNRWLTASLAVLTIAMSVALFTSVEKVRRDTRTSFTNTVSGIDLVVGARSGAIQLLLYSVFRIGNATNNISWETAEQISERDAVDWMIPISLGDSHRGFRVLGTTPDYFDHFAYGNNRSLALASGEIFDDVFDAVIGSDVAQELGYSVGTEIVVAHGTGSVGLVTHENQPFRVAGVLARTGTPVDDTVHVSLAGIEAMHIDWKSGMQVPGEGTSAEEIRQMDLQPVAVTALFIGLKSRGTVFREQRYINEYREEPLLAILPGVALQNLWQLMGVAENALLVISGFVVLAALVNLTSVLIAGLNERRREMAILRASGAQPKHIFLLLCLESALLSAIGVAVGLGLHYIVMLVGSTWIEQQFGLSMPLTAPTSQDLLMLGGILIAGCFAGCLPALRAYRQSIADGMTMRT